MNKFLKGLKAQAAMEFLMTYGWAILVVLIVISVLAYFSVLKPGSLLPEKCTFSVGVDCVDDSVTDSYVAVSLQNSAGRDIYVRGMTATGEALGDGNLCTTKVGGGAPGDADDCPTSVGIGVNGCTSGPIFANGEAKTITMAEGSCAYIDAREVNKYNVTLFYSWGDSRIILHQLTGEILARKP